MPKVKTTRSKSKQMLSAKRFKFGRLQLAALLLVSAAVGAVVIYRSQAATNNWVAMLGHYHCSNYLGIPPTISRGSTNTNCVKALQAALSIDQKPIPIDGKFGASTELSLAVYKNKVGLDGGGTAGPKAWKALAQAYNSRTAYGDLVRGTYPFWYKGFNYDYPVNGPLQEKEYLIVDGKYGDYPVSSWFQGVSSTQHFLQFGPYLTGIIAPGTSGLRICYDYASFNINDKHLKGYVKVYTDLAYNVGDGTKIAAAYNHTPAFQDFIEKRESDGDVHYYYPLKEHCDNYPLSPGTYPKMEFRLKVTGSSNPRGQGIAVLDLYRTRVGIYPY